MEIRVNYKIDTASLCFELATHRLVKQKRIPSSSLDQAKTDTRKLTYSFNISPSTMHLLNVRLKIKTHIYKPVWFTVMGAPT